MSTTESAELNERFAIARHLRFREMPGGLTVAEVGNSQATATIAVQGAHLMTWAPRREPPVIWLSRAAAFTPGKSIRGGVPICWPWFGPHATEPKFPGHGFARTVPWEVVETQGLRDGRTRLVLRLASSEATRAQWPHPSTVEAHITVGRVLDIELVTHNSGPAPITIGQALHTYFEVSDVRRVAIHGLGGCAYLDKVDGGKRKDQCGPVTIATEVDRIYLDTLADCLIDDPGLRRRIRVAKRGSRTTVVWNPWTEKAAKMGDLGENGFLNMVCVESANAADDVVTLAPGGAHHLAVRYGVEALR
jgi:D-hexose-6-phosphate mutarotase